MLHTATMLPIAEDPIAARILSQDLVDEVVLGMTTWDVKGCAIVVVPKEKGMGPPAGKFFGEREEGKVITSNTSFPLASCSKHITALALFLALDRLGLSFKTKVIDILPDFGLDDAEGGKNITVADLLGHQTGLPPWDAMYVPGLGDGILAKIKALPIPPSSGAKTFQYNSLLFDVAALLIPRLTNKPIDQFVQDEFFTPLGLKASYEADKIEERAVGRWTRVGGTRAEVEHTASGSGEGVTIKGSAQLAGEEDAGVETGVEVDYGLEQCGAGWGAGRVWMDSNDLIRWLVCTPKMPGFNEIIKPRTTDPYPGLFFADCRTGYGLGLRVMKHRGSDIVCHNGLITGFAHQLTWLPELKIGFAVLTNSDLGGTFLRSLVSCRIIEAAGGLAKRDWFEILDEKYKADISPQPWMCPLRGLSTPSTALIGAWSHSSFGTWTILPADIIPARPALGSLPYFPELYGQCRRLFTPIGTTEGGEAYAGCFECQFRGRDGKLGEVYYGVPFEVVLRDGGRVMEVRGLSGAEEGDEACPLMFVRQ